MLSSLEATSSKEPHKVAFFSCNSLVTSKQPTQAATDSLPLPPSQQEHEMFPFPLTCIIKWCGSSSELITLLCNCCKNDFYVVWFCNCSLHWMWWEKHWMSHNTRQTIKSTSKQCIIVIAVEHNNSTTRILWFTNKWLLRILF